jgi:peptidoglycan biosynthesis protein MviN/MurJ (putative lipid II flippase)
MHVLSLFFTKRMNQAIKKIISVFCLVIFLLGSGAGQLIHSIFHKHSFENTSQTSAVIISSPHSYCAALQLMLPEFSGTTVTGVPAETADQSPAFPHIEITIPHLCSFKTSDRAPPFLA